MYHHPLFVYRGVANKRICTRGPPSPSKQAKDEPPTRITLLYAPRDVSSVTRRHEVKQTYLRQHSRTTANNIPEGDVEKWIQVKTPGTLWQTYPLFNFGPQLTLEICCDGEDGSANYKFPLQGGVFETLTPAADLYGEQLLSQKDGMVDRSNKGQCASPGMVRLGRHAMCTSPW